jgi:hypothetical protein
MGEMDQREFARKLIVGAVVLLLGAAVDVSAQDGGSDRKPSEIGAALLADATSPKGSSGTPLNSQLDSSASLAAPSAEAPPTGPQVLGGASQSQAASGDGLNSVQRTMALVFNIPADSPELKVFADLNGNSLNFARPQKTLPSQILGHYVLTKGIPLPDPKTIVVPKLSEEQSKLQEEALAEARKRIDELTKLTIERWGEARAIESCIEGGSSKTQVAEGDKGSDVVLMDFLFLAKQPPLNAEELFGKSATVLQYKPGAEDPLSATVSGLGIPCLPYRIRFVGPWRFDHQGADALRDFDEAPLSKGKVNGKLRAVLEQYE